MCGRYASTRSAADLSLIFDALDGTDDELAPDYNVAPTDRAPIIVPGEAFEMPAVARMIGAARWGLVPAWATDPRVGARMINARSETVATSKVYGPAFADRRCLVPADGWFEWTRTDSGKQAYFMTAAQRPVFAGIWSTGRFGMTFSVLTTAARGHLAQVHDRMPLVLPRDRWDEWLTSDPHPALLSPPDDDLVSSFEVRPVGPAVGDVYNDGPKLIAAVVPREVQQTLF